MRKTTWIVAIAGVLSAIAATGIARLNSSPVQLAKPAGEPVRELLFAQPFNLRSSYAHAWRAEQPAVEAGWLVVLDVDREFVRRTQTAEPVLYVADQTAERVNDGDRSGRLIAIVPSAVGSGGGPALDLREASIWFGAPDLPEQIDRAAIAREAAAAKTRGVVARPQVEVDRAVQAGGALTTFADRTELERYAAELVMAWAPEERDFAAGLLQPLVR